MLVKAMWHKRKKQLVEYCHSILVTAIFTITKIEAAVLAIFSGHHEQM